MLTKDLLKYIETIAPLKYAEDWDQSGIQIAGTKKEIKRLALGLDPCLATIHQALQWDADFILTHHPLTLAPQLPKSKNDYRTILQTILQSGSWLYSAHTSLDVQTNGPVSWMARALHMEQWSPVAPVEPKPLLQIHLPAEAMNSQMYQDLLRLPSIEIDAQDFSKGYLLCDLPIDPAILNILKRYCSLDCLETAQVLPLNRQCGFGIIGDISPALHQHSLMVTLSQLLVTEHISSVGAWPETISRIAYCPGSGMSLAHKAFQQGAQIFISGDLKYHQAQELEPYGLVIDGGHFSLEETMMETWSQDLQTDLVDKDIEIRFFQGRNPFQNHDLGQFTSKHDRTPQ